MIVRIVYRVVVVLLMGTLSISRRLCGLLLRTVVRYGGRNLDTDGLRVVGRGLVSLAGDLTTLGVRMAEEIHWRTESPGPDGGDPS